MCILWRWRSGQNLPTNTVIRANKRETPSWALTKGPPGDYDVNTVRLKNSTYGTQGGKLCAAFYLIKPQSTRSILSSCNNLIINGFHLVNIQSPIKGTQTKNMSTDGRAYMLIRHMAHEKGDA